MMVTGVATVAAGLFAGASTYVTVVEHPARIESGGTVGIKQFGPSARRAAVMQALLAMVGLVAGVVAWFQGSGVGWLAGGLLLGVLIPFTLIVIMPVVRRLQDPQLDPASSEPARLLSLWGRLHAVRTVVGVAAFAAFVAMSVWS
jgi:uncharacterized membrane protein